MEANNPCHLHVHGTVVTTTLFAPISALFIPLLGAFVLNYKQLFQTSLKFFCLSILVMAFKAIVFMIASFLLLTSKVSSNVEESHLQATFAKPPVKTPTLAPVQAPAPAPYSRVLPPVSISECPRLCKVRCSLHSNLDRCMRACTTCCQRCRCVPPGTSGNREMCGKTYVEMTTHGGRPKCP